MKSQNNTDLEHEKHTHTLDCYKTSHSNNYY